MELLPLIKEIIYDGLSVTGLDNITSYLYGDEMVEMQDYPKNDLTCGRDIECRRSFLEAGGLKMLTVHEVSKLTGVSIRKLQYYDNMAIKAYTGKE